MRYEEVRMNCYAKLLPGSGPQKDKNRLFVTMTKASFFINNLLKNCFFAM